ncbi:MAG: aspartate-semialdehyde dehydrogenase [Clostridia bacterium]
MKKYNIAVLGATGAVGREMIKILEERAFPVNELRCLASAKSVGKKLGFCSGEVTVREADEGAFAGIDIVLGAVESEYAKRFAPHIKAAGAVFVDNSSAFRMQDDVPLVIPEINGDDALKHSGIIANPNCSTIIAMMAVKPIDDISPITSMVVSTYQAVSGAGAGGIAELESQNRALVSGGELKVSQFQHQIAYNLIPHIGGFGDNGYTSEEMKMQNEGRRIMHLPELTVSCTCVRVPVLRSHSISIALKTRERVEVAQARRAIAAFAGCRLMDEPDKNMYPMPLDTSDQDLVYVGRLRRDLTDEAHGLTLWCCGDQIRKGAATNAVQIAELLI